jgi:predicted nucleotidyltransferase
MLPAVAERKRTLPAGLEDVVYRIARNYQPSQVILFGSYAWGNPHPCSDVDLCVVKETPERVLQRVWNVTEMLDETGGVSFPLDLLVYTPREIAARLAIQDPFVGDIVRRGLVLYEAAHPGMA